MNRWTRFALGGLLTGLISWGCKDSGEDSGRAALGELDSLRSRLGCVDGPGPFLQVEQEDTEISTVPRIHWSASEALEVRAFADIGREADLENALVGETADSGELLFLGIPALTPAVIVLTAETDAGRVCSEPLRRSPAALDPDLPEITLSHLDSERAEQGLISTIVFSEESRYLVIINEHGEYIWALDIGTHMVSRGNFLLDGTGLIYMRWYLQETDDESGTHTDVPGQFFTVDFDGRTRDIRQVDSAHTDFVELPSGAIATLVHQTKAMEDLQGQSVDVLGDALVELSVEGVLTEVWSAFDEHAPALEGRGYTEMSFSHANSVSYFEDSDDFLIGVSSLDSIVRVDRETGEELWELAADGGDFAPMSGGPMVDGSHSATLLDNNELLVFNRMTSGSELGEACSEAISLSLDVESGVAEETWSYASDDCLLVVYFGGAIRLDGGNTLTVFSSSGQISQGSPDGQTVWQINTDVGGAFGFADFRSRLGPALSDSSAL